MPITHTFLHFRCRKTLSPPIQCLTLLLNFYLFRNNSVSNSFSASVVSPPTTSTPTAVSNFISLDGGKYNVSWMFHSSMDTFHFVVKVRATGWIGFGLATRAPNRMSGYDVAVSETNNGTKYLKDYFTGSFAVPPQDAKQDWMLSYFSEEQNVATLKFYRKRDTDDTANDIAIQPGQSYYFIWAYHFSDTVTPGRFPKHSFSGSYQVGPLIPSIQPTTTASTESPATPGTCESLSVTVW